ncbi:hypothetical protein [Paenibacillus mucilaginosus]|uniref:hypothetical protein n=1 Tax=Paenibacillus mucilaginosus TaxID=61624 RepID=UPI003D25DAA1
MSGETICLTGIVANAQGGYAFDTLDGIQEINLIEIDVPMNTDEALEEELRQMAYAIASHSSWVVDERE